MSVTREELDGFHRFAAGRLASADTSFSLDDLVAEWQSKRDRDQINDAIREGLADIEAGQCRPAGDLLDIMDRQYGPSNC